MNKLFNQLKLDETISFSKNIFNSISITITKEFHNHRISVTKEFSKLCTESRILMIVKNMQDELEENMQRYRGLLNAKGEKL